MFVALLLTAGGLTAATVYFSSTVAFYLQVAQLAGRMWQSVAFRQVLAIGMAITFVRCGLEPMVQRARGLFGVDGSWEKSNEHYMLHQVYRPLELLLIVAGFSTMAEGVLPALAAVPKETVRSVVRTVLSLTFVLSTATIINNVKTRFILQANDQIYENPIAQRRVEAVDKLITFLIACVSIILGMQAVGLDVHSVLAIGGVGGLAIGLAGRELLENLFTGLIIISTESFQVDDEVIFFPGGKKVEGIVVDIGWYRSLIRSFEREQFVVPNAVFSKSVLLNVTRKGREFRVVDMLGLRMADMDIATTVIADMRRIIRQDARVIQKLHRRVFIETVTRHQVTIYLSFYVEAVNRDAFLAIRQDFILAFAECAERNGAKMAVNRVQLDWAPPGVGGALAGTEGSSQGLLPGPPQTSSPPPRPSVAPM